MISSVPSFLKALMPNNIKRQLSCKYPISGIILSKLGKNMDDLVSSFPITNGIFVSSQKPVHLDLPHSKVRSNGMFLFEARNLAWLIIRRHGLSGCLARQRSYIRRDCSGWSSRHFFWRFRQYSGAALYLARNKAFLRCKSFLSACGIWWLCQYIACFRQQKRNCLFLSAALQTKHFSPFSMASLYSQNIAMSS